MTWLTGTYLVVAVLLTLPIQTHAVKIRLPPPTTNHADATLAVVLAVAAALGVLLAMVGVFGLITRGLAVVLDRRSARDR
jgi:biopolymer transport protein ExbD